MVRVWCLRDLCRVIRVWIWLVEMVVVRCVESCLRSSFFWFVKGGLLGV